MLRFVKYVCNHGNYKPKNNFIYISRIYIKGINMTDIANIKRLAADLAAKLDKVDGEDGKITADTWKKCPVVNWGAKDNVNNNISIFSARKSIEHYIKKELKNPEMSLEDIEELWQGDVLDLTKQKEEPEKPESTQRTEIIPNSVVQKISQEISRGIEQKRDAIVVDNRNAEMIASVGKAEKHNISIPQTQKTIIVNGMYEKWSKKFNNSPLTKEFYSKLYDVIKTLNCSVSDIDYDKSVYKSKTEQTMDQVIAILAGESKLNPKAKDGKYHGLFQLKTPGLIDIKRYAVKHPEVPGMKNINQNANIKDFWNMPGEAQLDYLVAHINNAKIYSKIKSNEKITPAQMWAMIKFPFEGKASSDTTAQKANAIKAVFKNSNIQYGIA